MVGHIDELCSHGHGNVSMLLNIGNLSVMMNGVVYIIHWVPICDFEFKYVLLFLLGEMKLLIHYFCFQLGKRSWMCA